MIKYLILIEEELEVLPMIMIMETPLIAMQMEAPSRPYSGVTKVLVIVKNSGANTATFSFILLNSLFKYSMSLTFVSCLC